MAKIDLPLFLWADKVGFVRDWKARRAADGLDVTDENQCVIDSRKHFDVEEAWKAHDAVIHTAFHSEDSVAKGQARHQARAASGGPGDDEEPLPFMQGQPQQRAPEDTPYAEGYQHLKKVIAVKSRGKISPDQLNAKDVERIWAEAQAFPLEILWCFCTKNDDLDANLALIDAITAPLYEVRQAVQLGRKRQQAASRMKHMRARRRGEQQ
jgi:hypothetical protein